MPTFTAQVAQNPNLPPGTGRVDAVVSISATPDGAGSVTGPLVEAFLIDCSGSMGGEKIDAAKVALRAALDALPADAWFCVVAGSVGGRVLMPLAPASPANKRAARLAADELTADGGTAMSAWLAAARRELDKRPGGVRHALLLTDGRNESEKGSELLAEVQRCEGVFQCDARGVGTDWVPDQLRQITGRLLGTVDIIPRPEEIAGDFRRVVEAVKGRSVPDVALRVWTPVGAAVEFCRTVFPQAHDLTELGRTDPTGPQVRDYPTGAWGAERRDYHLRIRVNPGKIGQRMCAARVSAVAAGTKLAEALVLASWTDDDALSAVIAPEVAHYTGQAELADSIRLGLKARESGDERQAEALLGRAVQIAAETNPDTLALLRRVVHIENEKRGTVKLLKGVRKEDEFALDTRSTKTARVKKDG
jgi:uncharacterized protein YegL